jgi:inorganic pyrophosphatase
MGAAMSDELRCIIEIPKGSRNKYELDHETGAIKLDRLLFSSVHYPTDYGFIPDTWAQDDDPLDAMVCVTEPTFPGCQIDVKPVGLLRMRDDKGIDDKIIAVNVRDPAVADYHDRNQLPAHTEREIKRFFQDYKVLEHKGVEVEDMLGPADAFTILREALQLYRRLRRGELAPGK